jgi:hypothetical protein
VEGQKASVGEAFPPGPWIILLTSPFMPFTPVRHPCCEEQRRLVIGGMWPAVRLRNSRFSFLLLLLLLWGS